MLPTETIAAEVARSLAEACRRENPGAGVLAAAWEVLLLVDHLLRRFEQEQDLPRPIVCQPGCSFCCYNRVELTPPEALLIGQFLAARFSPEAQNRLHRRVTELANLSAGWSPVQAAARRREHPCPLLDEDRCAVYPVRPLTCRAMHSLDAGQCRTSLESGELLPDRYYQHRHDLAGAVSRGLRAGAAAAGCQAGVLNLVGALQDIFRAAQAPARWAAGERLFTEA